VAQFGSAPALGAGGPGFKSRHPDQFRELLILVCARVGAKSPQDRSEWAPVISSGPVARALLLLELGLWARRTAARGSLIALPGPAAGRGTGDERHQLTLHANGYGCSTRRSGLPSTVSR
jgi:hypothetical protein